MATCSDCNQDMRTAEGCTLATVEIEGRAVPRIRHRRGRGSSRSRCGDCGAEPGGYHHLGCDLERCPRCRRQLISCGCWTDGVIDPDEDDDLDPHLWSPEDVLWGPRTTTSSTRCHRGAPPRPNR